MNKAEAWLCFRTTVDGECRSIHATQNALQICENRYTSQTHVALYATPPPQPDVQEREAMLDALTAAYHSGHREGWEPGPNTNEAMRMVLDALANAGFDPSLPAGKARLARIRGDFAQPAQKEKP